LSVAENITVDPAAEVLERAATYVDDLDCEQVLRWKKENPGAPAIGYMPVYVPRPLIEGLGCLPVAVFGGGDQIDIIRGDSYFQSYICHIPRSTIELALAGRLSALDGMLFPATCDVIRNLSGMWKMLFKDVFCAYVDLPQSFDPAVAGRFYKEELRHLAEQLVELGAEPLNAEKLWDAIEAENERCERLHALDLVRRAEPWRIRASEAYLVVRAGSRMPAREHSAMLDEYVKMALQRDVRPYDNVRVVLAGSFCEQPPLGLIKTLERAGCDIVSDDFQLGMRYIPGGIRIPAPQDRAGADPLDALVNGFLQHGTPTACRYIDDNEKGAALVEEVAVTAADGVVFAAASFCDPALLDQPMQEAALTRAGIPFTSLKFAENSGQFQTIREQAGAFSDSVKLWGTMP